MKWIDAKNTIKEAKKAGVILAKLQGYPFPTIAVYNGCMNEWVYASHQVNMVNAKYDDNYFESEYCNITGLEFWQPLPESTK